MRFKDEINVKEVRQVAFAPGSSQPSNIQQASSNQKRGVSHTNKFNATPTIADGVRHASKKEAGVLSTLRVWQSRGVIANLREQETFQLCVNNVHVCDYRADATFRTCREISLMTLDGPLKIPDGTYIVMDAKGKPTPAYKIKRKLMLGCHGIKIVEV